MKTLTCIALHEPRTPNPDDYLNGWLAGSYGDVLPDDVSDLWAEGHRQGMEIWKKTHEDGS